MGVQINFRIITKNHATDPEIRFHTKSISKSYGRATAMPPARELSDYFWNWTWFILLKIETALWMYMSEINKPSKVGKFFDITFWSMRTVGTKNEHSKQDLACPAQVRRLRLFILVWLNVYRTLCSLVHVVCRTYFY